MIKIYVDDESEISECKIEGTMGKIAAELLAIINYVYCKIKETDSKVGCAFKKLILDLINKCFDAVDEKDKKDEIIN